MITMAFKDCGGNIHMTSHATTAEVECLEEEQIWNRVTSYQLRRQMEILVLKFYRSMMMIRDLLMSIYKLAES